MADSFAAESDKHHEVEDVVVEIYENGDLITKFKMPTIKLTCTGGEIKKDIVQYSIDVPSVMKKMPQNCDLFYVDDEKKEKIDDYEDLLKYEEDLCVMNSLLQVAYPRCATYNQPKKDYNSFAITQKTPPNY